MKKFITFALSFVFIFSIALPCFAEKHLGMNRQEFIGRFIEATIDSGYNHLPTASNYFEDPSSPGTYYIELPNNLYIQIASTPNKDTIKYITVVLMSNGVENTMHFMMCACEIACAFGAVSSVAPKATTSQKEFLADIGFGDSSRTDGRVNAINRAGLRFWWQYQYENNAFVFGVDPQ